MRHKYDACFEALADQYRRKLLLTLSHDDGQSIGELCMQLPMSRQGTTKHLAILEKAKLVTSRWRGRERIHYLSAGPVHEVADGFIRKFERHRPPHSR